VAEIDAVLPSYDVHEVHSVLLPVAPEEALRLALALPVAPDRIVRALFRLRGLSTRGTIETLFPAVGFTELRRTPTEVVLGCAGRPWRPSGRLRPWRDAGPLDVRMAMDFRAVACPGGSSLTTETRVAASCESSRTAFRRYWRLVGPFSALIRRRWLHALSAASRTGSLDKAPQ
jgi:hypothetical protein